MAASESPIFLVCALPPRRTGSKAVTATMEIKPPPQLVSCPSSFSSSPPLSFLPYVLLSFPWSTPLLSLFLCSSLSFLSLTVVLPTTNCFIPFLQNEDWERIFGDQPPPSKSQRQQQPQSFKPSSEAVEKSPKKLGQDTPTSGGYPPLLQPKMGGQGEHTP